MLPIRPLENHDDRIDINHPMTHIAKMFGVSGNSIKKWCKSYGIEIPKYGRGFWEKVNHGIISRPQIDGTPSRVCIG